MLCDAMADTKRLMICLLLVLCSWMLAVSANRTSFSTKTGDKKTKKAKFTDVGNFYNGTKGEKSSTAVDSAQLTMLDQKHMLEMNRSSASKWSKTDTKTRGMTSPLKDGQSQKFEHKKKKHHQKSKKIKNEIPVDSRSELAVAAVPELGGAVGDGVLADSQQPDVDLLLVETHFETCDNCMITIADRKCPYYDDIASRFEVKARGFAEILRYGCHAQGRGENCCHASSKIVRDTSLQLTNLVSVFTQVLQKQCDKCPSDCEWGQWGAWDECPLTCERRNVVRKRYREEIPDRNGVMACHRKEEERDVCPEIPRSVGRWSEWSPWSKCLGVCDGVQYTERTCIQPRDAVCYTPCTGEDKAFRECRNEKCCNDRTWTDWGAWTDCSIFDSGRRRSEKKRWRQCEAQQRYIDKPMSPEPCFGKAEDTDICCHAEWSSWTPWTKCSSTVGKKDLETGEDCGKGCQNRTRVCESSPPGCATCLGDYIEHNFCHISECCVPPVWTAWCEWGACTVTGGQVIQRRKRSCQTSPGHWGSPTCRVGGCYGRTDDTETRGCNNCPPPLWGPWEPWSPCDVNTRTHTRRRTCVKATPYNTECSHLICPGPETETVSCTPTCDEGRWEWGEWGDCECPAGIRTRRRLPMDAISSSPLCAPDTMEEKIPCYECSDCDNNICKKRPNEKFPSCSPGCTKYVTCCEEVAIVGVCGGGQQYDSICRTCVRNSTTCGRNGKDYYLYIYPLPDKSTCTLLSTGLRRQRRSRPRRPTV